MRSVGKKTARLVAGELVREITAEGLNRLPSEAELLKRYPVSRPTLREALRILEMYGVISLKPGPGGGAVVNQVASYQFANSSSLYFHLLQLTLRDLMATRLRLEPFMARLAAERVARGEVDTEETDGEGVLVLSADDIHLSVARLSNDPILLLVAEALRDLFSTASSMDRVRKDLAGNVAPTHEAIEKAVRTGSASDAERLMREHLTDYVSKLEQLHPSLLDEVIAWT
ncbi:FadR/GntR family transcriptional regulator [Streptomyces chartreusis]|uniref:FadR/GntR family transcriptional regulator n=1 Tax=Streptomyces chartreusis TaxID=1969 RepID=UPI003715B948